MVNHPQGLSRFAAGFWRLAEWRMNAQQRLTFIEQCLELGVTTMDHADIYGGYQCEKLFGEALILNPVLRSKIQLVSKCGIKPVNRDYPERVINHYDSSREHIIASVNQSLKNFNTDYLDALLIHRPDFLMDVDEVVGAFDHLQQQGKVRWFGVSNFTPSQFSLLQSRWDSPLITNQIEMSPLNLQVLNDGTLDQCQQQRISPMVWSCLGGGKLFTESNEKITRIKKTLAAVQVQLGIKCMEAIVYAWILQLPCKPLPILGSGRIERIRQFVQAEQIRLDKQQWYAIWEAATGYSVP